MANTANMNLALPIVSQTLGPAWATQLNTALTQIDSHNHTSGQGVQVPSAGVNINADLTFAGFNATSLRTTRFADQGGVLTNPADVGCLYLASGNLYFNSGAGAAVQITAGSGLAGTPGSIGGLAAPAAVTYTSVNTTFRFTSNTNTNASIDVGNVLIRQPVANANSVTLQSPASLSANYSITLLTGLPVGQRILTIDNTGAMAAAWNVDNSTIQVSSNLIGVKAGGIGTTQIAAGAVTQATRAALGQQVSGSSSNFGTTSATYVDVVNLTVTITTTGRPVMLFLIPDGSASPMLMNNSSASAAIQIQMLRGATAIGAWQAGNITAPVAIQIVDVPAAGTYTYKIQALAAAGGTAFLEFVKLAAYEL